MASFISSSTTLPTHTPLINPKFNQSPFSSLSITPNSNPRNPSYKNLFFCSAAKQQQSGPVKKRQSNNNNSSNKKPMKNKAKNGSGFKKGFSVTEEESDEFEETSSSDSSGKVRYQPLPLPKPPAGFLVDDQGRVVAVSDRRIATIVDPANNFPLECVIRRVFRSSQGDECMLLCPIDTPVQILKSTNFEGWSAVSDDEVEKILPSASYALAKIHMHLVYSGFCYTARGGFCYTEDDIFECRTDDGQDLDGLPTEGVEITCFQLDGSHYMIYTPSDPLLFVAVKDGNGQLRIADDEVLEDPLTVSAIDEETEFNALVEEEAALIESLLGKR
ncbi:hypothetical protein M8C21_000742 [Ambrosia artemisiifolia]|uniref:Uncharacterized protein n=1 Tax=Ambrosia artemisiifolia TaxID=4212 RepID=A0AAD5CKK5_AMBAR|nr:hypothetical protein M8C21_000742 [Ambrosia artemisiifolia]